MRALVTGAAGFVGSTLCESLIASEDYESVVGVDCLTDYYSPERKRSNLAGLLPSAKFQFLETSAASSEVEQFLGPDVTVFHQAGQPGVRGSWGDTFSDYISNNVGLTQSLLERSKATGVHRFVYASSSSIYGRADRYPVTEAALPRPYSPYGVTKLAAEHLVTLYAENFGVPTVSLRYFTVYGPRQRDDMAFTKFFTSVKNHEPISVYGDGTQIRDFTFVDDVVDANLRAARADVPVGSVFNVCGGSSVTLREVIDLMQEVSGHLVVIKNVGKVAGDVFQTGGSNNLAEEVLGWSPMTDLATGLRRQWQSLNGING